MNTIHSKDGTTIAFEQSGTGPIIILVGAALTDHTGTAKLAKLLSDHFTVINYDRRGRGKSTDTPPYTVKREIEDLEALIDATGGSASLFGNSSGAALALEAANQLSTKINNLFLYEPPFIIDDSHPHVPNDLSERIQHLITSNRRHDAVRLFFTKGMNIPPFFVSLMRYLMPGWSTMVAIAHTIPYDLACLAGTQEGKPLPTTRWTNANMPTLVMVGSRSEPFFHTGAKALVNILPHAQYCSLTNNHHGSVLLSPKDITTAIKQFP